ncbi:hypothetical protein AMATHDRAFT_60899 [Amanita thiersii Skay4041]|uniref:Uncharacterized protein n=1 Tax=Amanita thiersii Skay4041 TaxID=703135 RepID=A0A2A9NS38_9AGAR|nr:hypothetical protein AMATHDRAFT_60899 [Amanita thiersii Skay4041]
MMPMSHTHGQWQSGSARSHPAVGIERRASIGEHTVFPYGPIINDRFSGQMTSDPARPRPTSSLAGAMGEAMMSPSRASSSSATSWSTSHPTPSVAIAMHPPYYPGVPGEIPPNYSSSDVSTYQYESPSARHNTPDSLPPPSPSYLPAHYSESYTQLPNVRSNGALPLSFANSSSYSFNSDSNPDQEVLALKQRIRELERECNRSREIIHSLRGVVRLPRSSNFQIGWEARTESRKRKFCSLNRAGNALCAWHDSRRERRAFPPRNAPPGYLNCGCTYEEALFEESLSRHGVGSYLPGEAVRMDPALRNPLLNLLQRTYGYKDGDFEHNPISETWIEGQAPEDWYRKAQEGKATKART